MSNMWKTFLWKTRIAKSHENTYWRKKARLEEKANTQSSRGTGASGVGCLRNDLRNVCIFKTGFKIYLIFVYKIINFYCLVIFKTNTYCITCKFISAFTYIHVDRYMYSEKLKVKSNFYTHCNHFIWGPYL